VLRIRELPIRTDAPGLAGSGIDRCNGHYARLDGWRSRPSLTQRPISIGTATAGKFDVGQMSARALPIGYKLPSTLLGGIVETEMSFVEEPEHLYVDRRRKVWLECNGEPYDFRAVEVLGTRSIAEDIPILKFICPRCGKNHQSLLFA